MVVGSGIMELRLPDCSSLKEKRSVLRRLISRTQNTFNISIAEVEANDECRRAVIGFSVVGNDRHYINGKIDKVLNFVDGLHLAELVVAKFEITNFSRELISASFEEEKYG